MAFKIVAIVDNNKNCMRSYMKLLEFSSFTQYHEVPSYLLKANNDGVA